MEKEGVDSPNVDTPNVVVTEGRCEQQKETHTNRWILIVSILVLLSATLIKNPLALFLIPANFYNKIIYGPDSILEHYIKNPLGDVSIVIPIHYASEFKFPDLGETTRIHINSRMQNEFFTLLDLKFDFIPGVREEYGTGLYPKDELFINFVFRDSNAIHVDGARNYAELYFTLESVDSNDIPFFLTQLLVDHCFRDGIEKYSPSNFYQVESRKDLASGKNTSFLLTADSMDNEIIARYFGTKRERIDVDLNIYLIGADIALFDMDRVYEKSLKPILDSLSSFFQFHLKIRERPLAEIVYNEVSETDDAFPEELSNLPLLWDLYKTSKAEKQHIDFNMIFYPYEQGGPLIEEVVVNQQRIYSSDKNNQIKIDDWGSIYFANVPRQEYQVFLSLNELQEFTWNFKESLLDMIGAPNKKLSPELRVSGFKRFMVVQYLLFYSSLLAKVQEKITWSNMLQSNTDIKHIIDCLSRSLQLRDNVLQYLNDNDLETALNTAEAMLSLLENITETEH